MCFTSPKVIASCSHFLRKNKLLECTYKQIFKAIKIEFRASHGKRNNKAHKKLCNCLNYKYNLGYLCTLKNLEVGIVFKDNLKKIPLKN